MPSLLYLQIFIIFIMFTIENSKKDRKDKGKKKTRSPQKSHYPKITIVWHIFIVIHF